MIKHFSPARGNLLWLILIVFSCSKNKLPLITESDKLFVSMDAEYTGVNFENTIVETSKENHLINEDFVTGAGVAIGDINNDGLLDLYFTGNQVKDKLYLNKGQLVFEDISEKVGLNKNDSWSTGVTFVDINSDGYQDIYVCKNVQGKGMLGTNCLYINNGDLTFEEKAKEYRINDRGYSKQAYFFDYDKDGNLDMYLVNQPPGIGNRKGGKTKSKYINPAYSDKLYKNLGKGRGFVEVSALTGTKNAAHGLSAAIGDINNDGWPDIYVANDYDEPDYMYLNNKNGTFRDVLKKSFKHISNFSMGSDIADYDNDGNLDIMVLDMVAENHKRIKTNMGGMRPENFWKIVNEGGHYQYMFNTLQRNNGNGTFSDLAQLAGVSNTDWSWGPLIADFDNDGFKDIFVTNGIKRNMRNSDINNEYEKILDSIEVVAKNQNKKFQDVVDVLKLAQMAPEDKIENYIYKNNGDLTFSKKVKDWGINTPSLSKGAAYADLDNDGDLDLVVSNVNQKAFVYRNTSTEKKKGNFLRVKLKPQKQGDIYGARIKIFKESKLWQVVELTNARGYMSKSEDIAHFGLGDYESVEKILVEWTNGKTTQLNSIEANQIIQVKQKGENYLKEKSSNSVSPMFQNVTKKIALKHRHQENNYNDYDKQVLLPHKMSQFGPSIGVGDVNGDNLDDFFVGGAVGTSGVLYIQSKDGSFQEVDSKPFLLDKNSEDMGCVFIDIDSDGDLDLFVVSGGYEFKLNDKALQDRLYINDGEGNFKKDKNRVPKYLTSGSTVIKADYDGDGDEDLFVAGRLVPGNYPYPANSVLLENRNGYFVNVTNSKAKELNNLGMVTSAEWVDLNGDNKLDLVIVGEWMPISTFIQDKAGNFESKEFDGLTEMEGWYYEVSSADIDNDGDNDLVFGNLGLNYKYKTSKEKPFQIHSYDFDKNNSSDIVLSYFEEGDLYPIRGRSCSIEQIPSLNKKFPTYESFGNSNLRGIYGEDLDKALNLKARNFASVYAENINGISFKTKHLPKLAQVSSTNSIIIEDFDLDGNKDLLLSGNLYTSEIETPRNDAGIGLFLHGNGKGDFEEVPVTKSGFFAPHDAKDMKKIKIGNKNGILVGNNNHYLQAFIYEKNDDN